MEEKYLEKIGLRKNCAENFAIGCKYEIPYLTIPPRGNFKIIKVISPSLIFIKLLNDVTASLNETINSQYHIRLNIEERVYWEMKNFCCNTCEGFLFRYCLAPINDKEYGRGRIVKEAFQLTNTKISNSKKFVKVFFIDTAEEGWFSIDSLYELPIEKYLTPWQIVPVSLCGITPLENNLKFWNQNICQELNNILKNIAFVEIINGNNNITCGWKIMPVKMIGFYDSNGLVGEDVAAQLFCKFPLNIIYMQFPSSNNFFYTFNEIVGDSENKLFDDNIPIVDVIQNFKNQEKEKNRDVVVELKDNIKSLKREKLKEKKQLRNVKTPKQTILRSLSFNVFLNSYKKYDKKMNEVTKFCSPQIPIWTKNLLKKFNYIGPDNKMYLELLPFEETSYGEEIIKNPLELHAAMLRYQPEDVVIREDILYNTLELEYYSERMALQNKLNYFYSQAGNLSPINQMEILRDLNNGYPIYGIYFNFNDYGIFIANRIEILSVELVNDKDIFLNEQEMVNSHNNQIYKINEESFDILKSVKIRFLDYGGIVITSVKSLSKIHSQFCFLPPFSIQINLIPLTKKIYSIASEENREFILKYYDYFNAAVDLKTPMLAIFDSHQGTLRKKKNKTYTAFFEDNCEWEYNHVINISNMQRLFPRGIPIDMTIDSYLNFLEDSEEQKSNIDIE